MMTRLGLGAVVLLVCCGLAVLPMPASGRPQQQPQPGGEPLDMPGLHNVIFVSKSLFSGGVPEGDAGFASLARLGIKTIISVDGAKPDVERAKKAGMRYVHLPIGYDGIIQDQALALAKAVRDLPGPVFIHCHHGKHRSPAAAAAVQMCLDPDCTVSRAVEIMKRAGTDPHYTGLYAVPSVLKRPAPDELNAFQHEFPAIAKISALAEVMVQIDKHWEHLTLIRSQGWKAPRDHADLDPPHEALQLLEQFREMARLDAVKKRSADFKAMLTDAEKAAQELESALRASPKIGEANPQPAEKAFQRSRALCTQCHTAYRDNPSGRAKLAASDKAWQPILPGAIYRELVARESDLVQRLLRDSPKDPAVHRAKFGAVLIAGLTMSARDGITAGELSEIRTGALSLATLLNSQNHMTAATKLASQLSLANADPKTLPADDSWRSYLDAPMLMVSFLPRAEGGDGLPSDLQSDDRLKGAKNGILEKIRSLSTVKLTEAALEKEAKELELFAYRTAVIGALTYHLVPAKMKAKKTPDQWRQLALLMRDHSVELAVAAQNRNGDAVLNASSNLRAACSKCHNAF
jgi:protein tyrosine phosphatase (PTP) superfamily phosphohydrolase (DUF442 family)/cytochrome c556